MQQSTGQASLMAGGTNLMVQMKEHVRTPAQVINIKKIPGLDDFSYSDESGLRLGAPGHHTAGGNLGAHTPPLCRPCQSRHRLCLDSIGPRWWAMCAVPRHQPTRFPFDRRWCGTARSTATPAGALQGGGLLPRPWSHGPGRQRNSDAHRNPCATTPHWQGLHQAWPSGANGAGHGGCCRAPQSGCPRPRGRRGGSAGRCGTNASACLRAEELLKQQNWARAIR